TNAEAITIRVFNIETGFLEIAHSSGVTENFINQAPIRVGEGIIGNTVLENKPFSTPDATQEALCKNTDFARSEGIKAMMCVPMNSKENTIGCITVYRKTNNEFAEHDLMLLSIFSAEAVEAIEKARLIAELKKQATTDPLTGLFNKRAIIEKLQSEIDRSKRHKHSTAILFIDIDNFKTYNDSDGHLMGDKLLHDFTALLHKHCRTEDLLGRFGGDEFIVIAPQSSLTGALSLAKKLCKEVEQYDFISSNMNQPFKTTCSIGIALYPEHSDNYEDLMEKADKALFISKRGGRNRATVWQENTDNTAGA
ncbi:MAG TPA: GGDEF domain-containing protein, partial [Candidatus Tenderia electrophaga]|nr:GGDEF domain-containing protein [Candidatus Tenderia electrophaga]